MSDVAPALGVLAGLVGIGDTIPYVRDTLRGATRPHRGTWLIWSVLAMVVCLSQRADGASWSLLMVGTQAVLTSLIFLLAIDRGEGGMSRSDAILIAIASGGVIGWILADEPIIATGCVVVADLIGATMKIPKTYRDPDSETLATFAFASLSGMLAAGAVGALDLSLLLYPVYFFLVNGAMAIFIHHRRAAVSAERERVARDPGREAQRQAVALGLRKLDEAVEPLAADGDATAVDVGPGVRRADRAAVELDAKLAGRTAA